MQLEKENELWVFIAGESDSELPEALNKYGNSLQNGMEKYYFWD